MIRFECILISIFLVVNAISLSKRGDSNLEITYCTLTIVWTIMAATKYIVEAIKDKK